MPNMNISMNLSLVDTASPQVKAFISTLQALEQAVSNSSTKLSSFATAMKEVQGALSLSKARMESAAQGIASIGAAAANSGAVSSFAAAMNALGASLGSVKTNSATAATELGAVGARAGTAAAETVRLETSMAGLSAALSRVGSQLATTTSGLIGVGGAAAVATTEAGAAMNAVGFGAQGANTHVNTLADSIKGMAKLWAAFKIEKGLKESVVDAAENERTENRLRNMNLSPEESKGIHEAVSNAGRDFHQFNQNEYLEMAIDLRNATGSAHEAAEGLKGFAQSVFAINLSMPSGKKLDEQGTLNFAKFLEGRGVTMDPAAMEAQQDLVTKIVAATQGRVNPNNLFGNLTYAKGGLGRTMDDEALLTFAALIEEDQVGGGTGGRVGTMMTQLVNSVTKSRAITTKNRDEWLKLGLVDPEKVNVNQNTNQITSIQAGAIAGTEIAGKNFKTWVDEYLRPALIAAGVNMSDTNAIKQKTDILFPNTQAAEGAFQLLSKKDLIEKDVANIRQTAGKQQQVENGLQTPGAKWERFQKTIDDLAIAIGKTLNPVLVPLLEKFTSLLELFGKFTKDHPILTHFAVLATAIGSVALAISGVKSVFGVFGTLTAALSGVAGQSVVTATAVEGAAVATGAAAARTAATSGLFGSLGAAFARLSGVVATAAGAIAKGFLRMIPWVGALLVAWDLAGLIGNLEVGGRKISDWASSLADKVATSFQNMWVRTKQYFGFLSKDAADAQVEANNRASGQKKGRLNIGADQNFTKKTYPDQSSLTSPAGAPAQTEEEKRIAKLLADNKARASGLGGGKPGGRFKNYDVNLDDAKNKLRLEEDELARHMKVEEELYKANQISINEYYDDKLATVRKSVNAQIAELEREKAAYQKQGDKAGVNRATTEIELRKRDLKDNEKSVEVQREKDLNALKERRLALEALILDAEGKRRQSQLAHDIQRAEKDKADFLANPDAPGAAEGVAAAQKVIDIAKLTAAWDEYGDDVKKIQEDTQTKEAQVDAQVRSGSLSKLTAEQKVFDLRKEEARQLDDLIKKERALIEASNAPQEVKDKLLKALGLAEAKADATTSEMNPELARMKGTLNNSLKGGFENFFDSVISRSKSAGDAIKDFANNIKSTFTKLISEQLGKDLFKSLFGEGVGSGGGMLGDLWSGLKGMFGSKSSGPNANADISQVNGSSGGSILDSIVGWFHSFDVGTDEVPQDMIAHIHKGEMIVPAYDAERLRNLKPGGGSASTATPPILQIHPDAFHMKLGDWFESEMSRQLAHR